MKGLLFILVALLATDAAVNHSAITISLFHGANAAIHGFGSSVSGSIFAT